MFVDGTTHGTRGVAPIWVQFGVEVTPSADCTCFLATRTMDFMECRAAREFPPKKTLFVTS